MSTGDFDERYPAMFQPGGERADAEPTVQVAQLPRFNPEILDRDSGTSQRIDPERLAEPAQVGYPDGWDISVRETHWSVRSWFFGLGAVVLIFGAAAFCLMAAVLIPSARSVDPNDFHGIMVTPWGFVIYPGAPAFFTAGLGMVAAMFLLGSLHYGEQAHWLRAGLAMVALVALTCGTVAVFGATLMPEVYFDPARYQEGANSIPWPLMLQLGKEPLLVLGFTIAAVMMVVRTKRKRRAAAVSAKAAVVVGVIFIGAALWAWFAPQLFPLQLGSEIRSLHGIDYSTMPWPQTITQIGGPLTMVGAGALLWGVLLLATSRPSVSSPPAEENQE